MKEILPSLAQAIPQIDLEAVENYSSSMKQLLPLEAFMKQDDQSFAVSYLNFFNSFEHQSMASLLFFLTAVNQRQYSVPCFEYFLEKRQKLASSLAIKCYGLPSLHRFVGSQRLNAKRASDKIKKLEVAHRLFLEMLDGVEVEVENSENKVNSRSKNFHSSDAHFPNNELFYTKLKTLERNDYCESFVLLQALMALTKSGIGEIYVSSMISVVLNVAIKELILYTEGHMPLHVQTIFSLYKIARLAKLTNLEADLIRIVFSIRKFPSELEKIMHWKLLTSILVKQSPSQADSLIFDKFCKTLFYSKDHLAEARDAMKVSWTRFDQMCKNMISGLPLDHVLSEFDNNSLFHSKTHFHSIESRFIILRHENTFIKDILVMTENPVIDLISKLSNYLMDKKFMEIGLYNKSIIIMLQSSLRRSLSNLKSARSRP